ncbi:MAG: ABC transporter substrate-binding protein, partial [Bacillota bacterium]
MFRKFGVLLLAVMLTMALFLLSGCGGQAADNKNMPEVVKIGFVGPLTGANASEGIPAKDAFEMLFDEANKKNLLPYDIEVVAYDDASMPEAGAETVQNLVKDESVLAAS